MRRELDEEVSVTSPGRIRLVGMINDDSTPVGQVHLGVVHLFELERPEVTAREEGLAEPQFLPISTVLSIKNEFETWSQICIDAITR
jgi:predicted NUDIX family phosphoesterase